MADGVNITPGTGVKISSEEVTTLNGATVSAQQVGRAGVTVITADGTAVDVTSSTPLPVDTQLTQPTTPSDTQPVSAASLPLPTGAATAAKQPALGTAGTPSADVITVQGKTSMTPLLVDGSATTQPVSGTFWQTTQPVSGTVAVTGVATSTKQSDGSQKTQIVDGSGNVIGATSNALDINIKSGNPTSITANAGTNLNTSALALDSTLTGKTQFTKLTDGTDTALITASGEQNVIATAQPGVDIGDVTINNSTGASAVNIQDGGNSITVDGTVTVNAGTNLNTSALALDATLTGGNQQVQGNAASSATDSGNPVKTGGVNKTTPPTLTDGQRGDTQLDTRANTKVSLWAPNSNTAYSFGNGVSGTGVQRVAIASDNTAFTVNAAQSGTWTVGANSATGSAFPANVFAIGAQDGNNQLHSLYTANKFSDSDTGGNSLEVANRFYNGSSWDRNRNNESVTLLASAARTTTQTSADLVNYNGASFLDVILDTTVFGSGSVTLTINGKDPASGKYYLLLSGVAVVSVSTNVYRVGVGLTAAANLVANVPLPRTFQIVCTANNANSQTYSVGYNLTRG